jgi:hypothetical protein
MFVLSPTRVFSRHSCHWTKNDKRRFMLLELRVNLYVFASAFPCASLDAEIFFSCFDINKVEFLHIRDDLRNLKIAFCQRDEDVNQIMNCHKLLCWTTKLVALEIFLDESNFCRLWDYKMFNFILCYKSWYIFLEKLMEILMSQLLNRNESSDLSRHKDCIEKRMKFNIARVQSAQCILLLVRNKSVCFYLYLAWKCKINWILRFDYTSV